MNGFSGAEAGPAFTNLRWFYDMTGMLYIETDLPHGVKVLWKVYCYIIILISQNVESNCWGSREPEYSVVYTSELSSSLVYISLSYSSIMLQFWIYHFPFLLIDY